MEGSFVLLPLVPSDLFFTAVVLTTLGFFAISTAPNSAHRGGEIHCNRLD